VPVAWLKVAVAAADERRALIEARMQFHAKAARVAAKRLGEEPGLADRAVEFYGERMLREQRTREEIIGQALADLKANPPQETERHVDEDWLEMFARHAETKTSTEVQTYFARVLAGEIRKPGTFSAETIDVLAKISPQAGQLFQRFCNLTAEIPTLPPVVLTEPFGEPGSNALAPVGFGYDQICRLQDAGLVRTDLNSYFTLAPLVLQRIVIGGKMLQFRMELEQPATEGAPTTIPRALLDHRQCRVLRLTVAGQELRRIVHMVPNDVYIAKFIEWAQQLKLTPA
jgi:hypothetical protein